MMGVTMKKKRTNPLKRLKPSRVEKNVKLKVKKMMMEKKLKNTIQMM
jgi:hypothetical protein